MRDAFGNAVPTTAKVKRGPGRPIKRHAPIRPLDDDRVTDWGRPGSTPHPHDPSPNLYGESRPGHGVKTRGPGRSIKRGDGEIRSRSGEILTRNRVSGNGYVNEFDIPAGMRDPDWDLHWARTSVHGKSDPANMNALYDNGWRPASPKNYADVMPDMRGRETIERDGMILMERPMQLTHQALAEAHDDALELRETSAETFGSRKLPKGFDKGRKSRKGNFDASKRIVRGEYVQSPKEARPAYEYADADE